MTFLAAAFFGAALEAFVVFAVLVSGSSSLSDSEAFSTAAAFGETCFAAAFAGAFVVAGLVEVLFAAAVVLDAAGVGFAFFAFGASTSLSISDSALRFEALTLVALDVVETVEAAFFAGAWVDFLVAGGSTDLGTAFTLVFAVAGFAAAADFFGGILLICAWQHDVLSIEEGCVVRR